MNAALTPSEQKRLANVSERRRRLAVLKRSDAHAWARVMKGSPSGQVIDARLDEEDEAAFYSVVMGSDT